jgi:very-short-patch-repair endonuclease
VAQLRAAGISSSAIGDRVAVGRLHRVHRGVYAVGHSALREEGQWLAAVLACGERAILSHRSAAALWGILPSGRAKGTDRLSGRSADRAIDVTVRGSSGRARRRGINLHRSRTLLPSESTVRAAIPVTKPGRTLDDLRRVVTPKEFAAAVREAEFLRLPIGRRFAPDRTRTELEGRLLALCRRHRLPKPRVNARVGRFVVDFLWLRRRVIVEVDGWESHRTRSAFETDRARDARLKLSGYDVLRFTWRQIDSDSAQVAATIRALLSR